MLCDALSWICLAMAINIEYPVDALDEFTSFADLIKCTKATSNQGYHIAAKAPLKYICLSIIKVK